MEGYDMCGKTEISKALSEKLNVPIIKVKRNEKWFDPLIDLLYGGETMVQMLEQIGVSAVFDRCYPSEYAYSKVYNRPTSIEKLLSIDERFAKMNGVIVICYKDTDAQKEDDNVLDGKPLIDKSKYDMIFEKYLEFTRLTKCRVLMLNTTNENLDEQITKIINFIN